MSILPIDKRIMFSNDLFLRKPSRKLEKDEVLSDDFRNLVSAMFEMLYESQIGVGLAAPQIGLQICLAVIDIKGNGKNPLVLINPEYSPIGSELKDSNEGCLSFCDYAGVVKRYKKIVVKAKDINFDHIEFETDTYLSMVCQHEIDHLNGQVYIDKTVSLGIAESGSKVLAEQVVEKLYLK